LNTQWSRTDQRWYLGVLCRKCRSPILFAVDYSDGGTNQMALTGMLMLTCTHEACKHKADYTDAIVLRFQKSMSTINQNRETISDKNRNRKA
jgi:hypothetical protein